MFYWIGYSWDASKESWFVCTIWFSIMHLMHPVKSKAFQDVKWSYVLRENYFSNSSN